MKRLIKITIILLFITQNLSAQYNISPDAPKNPLPLHYHKEHFKLKGDIKVKRYNFGTEGNEDYVFNKLGYLTQRIAENNKTIYIYDSNNKLKKIDYQGSNAYNVQIILDQKDRITEKRKTYNSDIYKTETIEKYDYDHKSNLIKYYTNLLSDDSSLYLHTQYAYDNKNRVIEKKQFKPDGSIRMTTTYAYQKEGDFLKITINSGGYSFIEYYDKKGHHCGDKPQEVKTDEKGNPLNDANIKYIYFSDPDSILNCISGDCQSGWGTYKNEKGTYTGFFKDGMKEGYGKFTWNDGKVYEGQWKQNKISGHGIILTSTTDSKQGEFEDGKLNGLGIVQTQNTYQPGVYKNGELVSAYNFTQNGNQTGCIGGNCNDGFGQYHWESGSKFLGFFKNSKPFLGTYYFANNEMYIGYFNQNIETNRFGFYIYESGDVYYGEWKNGKPHGKGYYKYLNGTEYAGIWENGKFIKSLK